MGIIRYVHLQPSLPICSLVAGPHAPLRHRRLFKQLCWLHHSPRPPSPPQSTVSYETASAAHSYPKTHPASAAPSPAVFQSAHRSHRTVSTFAPLPSRKARLAARMTWIVMMRYSAATVVVDRREDRVAWRGRGRRRRTRGARGRGRLGGRVVRGRYLRC